VVLVGTFSTILLGGPSDRPTARHWERRLAARARAIALVAITSGIASLLQQSATLEGRAGAAFELRSVWRLALETQAGQVWLGRHGLLLLLTVFLVLPGDLSRTLDWIAARGEALLLSLTAIGLVGASSHAAALVPGAATAIAIDTVHLLAAGVWVGGLLPLALLLRAATAPEGADARPYAVLTARRFSPVALGCVLVLAVSGFGTAIREIGSIPGLVGTAHGQLLCAKLGIIVVIVALARVNRARLIPALSGPAPTVGRPAMQRLSRAVMIEAGLAAALLALVAAMTLTPPARHQQPTWPFSFRLSAAALSDAPTLRARVLIASQIAVLGGVAILSSLGFRRQRWPIFTAGVALSVLAAGVGLPSLTVDAYPTTYRRPGVPYQASAIASGAALYREHCSGCHGRWGAGDGPRVRDLSHPPRDLRGRHLADHPAGDLFWWITRGIPARGMPAFGDRLADEERWEVVNFIRALQVSADARNLEPRVRPERPRLPAPDFSFAVGPAAPQSLKDYRGRIVLLVFYTLPGSKPRLAQLAQAYPVLGFLGVEVIAVPVGASPDAIRELGADPPMLFPVVTDGAVDVIETYGLFSGGSHTEFLIDRQGYLRARWTIAPGNAVDVTPLLAGIQQLNEEKAVAAAAAEHVH
jgi:putative copper export protein/mono/diheme cytochrome c family protein/peroxiredoxin